MFSYRRQSPRQVARRLALSSQPATTSRPSSAIRYTNVCVPSQCGLLLLCLHPQKNTLPLVSASKRIGVNSLPACDPSQNGWLSLFPQAHQKYFVPASTSTANGPLCAMFGSATVFYSLNLCLKHSNRRGSLQAPYSARLFSQGVYRKFRLATVRAIGANRRPGALVAWTTSWAGPRVALLALAVGDFHGTGASGERQRPGAFVAWTTSWAGPRVALLALAVGH